MVQSLMIRQFLTFFNTSTSKQAWVKLHIQENVISVTINSIFICFPSSILLNNFNFINYIAFWQNWKNKYGVWFVFWWIQFDSCDSSDVIFLSTSKSQVIGNLTIPYQLQRLYASKWYKRVIINSKLGMTWKVQFMDRYEI